VPLGFLAAALGWQGTARGIWPAWFPVLVFSPFLVDATVTLVRRFAHRENVWRAHRSHYYQRLVLGGWSHRRLALRAWILMAAIAGSALLALDAPEMLQRGILLAWAVVFGVFMILIDRRHPREPS
jgi:UDP-N-acetylmuramyl pentapeptide phosphotransferase/UDP-N-acetylglucosamine-1-phosphate transferase